MPSTLSTSARRAQTSDVTATVPANIRLDEDVLKTSWRRLSSSSSKEVFKTSSRRLDEYKYILVNHTSSEDVFKMSSKRLGQDQYICLVHTSSRCLQDVLPRRLQNISQIRLEDIFKMFWRRIIKLNCFC